MGKKLDGFGKFRNSEVVKSSKKETERNGGDPGTAPASAEGDSTAGAAGEHTDGGQSGKTSEKEKEQGTGLLVLNSDDSKKELTKIKQRKPRKVKSKNAVDNTVLNMFFGGVFAFISSRPGCEHWAVSEDELNSITTPLANILNKYEAFEKIAENSDAIALVTASVVVVAPRAMISMEKNKEKRRVKDGNKNRDTGKSDRNSEGINQKSVDGNDGVNAAGSAPLPLLDYVDPAYDGYGLY